MRFNKSDMLIFFTDGEIENGHNTGDVYVSERLPVTIIPEGSSIRVQVNDGVGLAVEKNHQPGKGDLVGPLAIGDIFFKAIA